MVKVKNSLNARLFEKTYEKGGGLSLTVPDQTLSIREIMRRFTQGLGFDGIRVPIYDEENDLPDLRRLDISERHELAEQYKSEINDIKNRKYEQQTESAPAA